jgi:uncharacterized repeat protein (TIGR03843 family)
VSPLELTPDDVGAFLAGATLEVVGRMRYASNGTFLVEAKADGIELHAVYKPQRGERPLWDFPHGTLGNREVAAYEVSKALGWDVVPVTVMRSDGPLGAGSLQRFVEHDPEEHYFTLFEGREERFRQFAVFDVLVNNTDRKASHCLRDRVSDTVIGIDHGLTFHAMWKLRTVIWDFAGEQLPPAMADAVYRIAHDAEHGGLGDALAGLLAPAELAAFGTRADDLVREGYLPDPDPGYHSVPWPVV